MIFNIGLIRLSKVLVLMVFFMHFYACVWYFVAKIEGFQPDCWVIYHGLIDAPNITKYLTAFYWYIFCNSASYLIRVMQTATTVGYGDMNVNNDTERILAIVLMIFGVGFYSITIGTCTSILSTMDSKELKLNVFICKYIYI